MLVKSAYFRNGKSRINGKGVGAVLLDGGQGGQSSYESPADWMATIKHGGSVAAAKHNALGMGIQQPAPTIMPVRSPPMRVPPAMRRPVGLGAHQIARISSLMMKSSSPKPKAIHFSL